MRKLLVLLLAIVLMQCGAIVTPSASPTRESLPDYMRTPCCYPPTMPVPTRMP